MIVVRISYSLCNCLFVLVKFIYLNEQFLAQLSSFHWKLLLFHAKHTVCCWHRTLMGYSFFKIWYELCLINISSLWRTFCKKKIAIAEATHCVSRPGFIKSMFHGLISYYKTVVYSFVCLLLAAHNCCLFFE